MKKTILFLCICLFVSSQNFLAQNFLEVSYMHSTKMEGTTTEMTVVATLLANNNSSVYEMDYIGDTGYIDEIKGEKDISLNIRASNNPKVYKDVKSNSIYSIGRVGMEPYIVKDTTIVFNWELKNVFKNIMGYNCQMAMLTFRGRDYVAYYTNELPIQNGPWKFSGLPGLILEIKSSDGFFKIEAFELNISDLNSEIQYPFNTKIEDAVTWQEFVDIYKKKSENPFVEINGRKIKYALPKRKIEVIIED
jgi:GLPGLI family protein